MGVLCLERDRIRDGDATWASVDACNPLEDGWGGPKMLGPRVVCWSGWLGPEIFARDVRTWGPGGWSALERACEGMEAGRVLLRTHARHVLSDAQRCLAFLRRWEGKVGLLLDPMAMLEVSMLDRAEEHLDRIVGALGAHPGVGAMVACNLSVEGEEARAVGMEAGVVGAGLIDRMLARARVPVVVLEAAFGADAARVKAIRA